MREDLVGFLMGALDDSENEGIKARLDSDPEFRERLARVERKLAPLAYDDEQISPPTGLAKRTCEFVEKFRSAGDYKVQPVVEPASKFRREMIRGENDGWTFSDFVVAAGICLAAACLFFPAILNGRVNSRMAACQNNLRNLGQAFQVYSESNNGYFPTVPASGKLAFAGSYAAILRDNGLIDQDSRLLDCPSQGTKTILISIPLTKDINSADGSRLYAIQKSTGGDYAYSLGFIKDRKLNGIRRRLGKMASGRARTIVLADSPLDQDSRGVHGRGQNVLFEDGRAGFLATKLRPGSNKDNIYVNDNGYVQPGLHSEDAVLAPSWVPVVLASNSSRN